MSASRRPPLALALALACAPNPNEPPTKIDDPKSELPAPKATSSESAAAEKRRKQAAERRAIHEKNQAEKARLAAERIRPVSVGAPAPDFTLPEVEGGMLALSSMRGKTVVLEWFNPECPFVKYAHGEGPLVDQAARVVDDDLAWWSINSGAPGKQGHGVEKNAAARQSFGMENPVLIDESGTVGRRYGAKTTPHMVIIDPQGTVVYRGAIDNAPMGTPKDGGETINYVDAALADLAAGRPVATPETKPYGCSVKYAG